MPRSQVTITPPGGSPYQTTLEELGVETPYAFTLSGSASHNLDAELSLTIKGSPIAGGGPSGTDLAYRSRVRILLEDGAGGFNPFFDGIVCKAPQAEKSGRSKSITIHLMSHWFWFRDQFLATLHLRAGLVDPADQTKGYKYIDQLTSHFTINRDPTTNLITKSRQQVSNVLDYLIAKGCPITYDPADIADVCVTPAAAQNNTCAEIIESQFQTAEVVMDWDITGETPRFFVRPAAACPPQTFTFKESPDQLAAMGLSLTRLIEQEVPGVKVIFEQAVNGDPAYSEVKAPAGYNDANLFNLITTVTLAGISISSQSTTLDIGVIDPTNLDFWKTFLPKLADPNEYDALAIVHGMFARDYPALPNYVIKGSVPDWLAGTFGKDRLRVQLTYRKKTADGCTISKVQTKTFSVVVYACNLAAGLQQTFSQTNVSSSGENPADFAGIADQIYADLSRPKYAGTIPVIEPYYSGRITLGKVYNVDGLNTRPEWASMNALAQQIRIEVHNGCVKYQIAVGPNPWLTAQTIAGRLRAKREANYVPAINFTSQGSAAGPIRLPAIIAGPNNDEAEPTQSEHTVTDQIPAGGQALATLTTTGPDGSKTPGLVLATTNATKTKAGVATPQGKVELYLSDLDDADGESMSIRWGVACSNDQYYKFKLPRTSLIGPITKEEADAIIETAVTENGG